MNTLSEIAGAAFKAAVQIVRDDLALMPLFWSIDSNLRIHPDSTLHP